MYAIHNNTYMAGNGSLVSDPAASVYVVTGDAGNREGHEPFTMPQPKWSAFRSNTYGYARMEVHNSTHLLWEQVQVVLFLVFCFLVFVLFCFCRFSLSIIPLCPFLSRLFL